MPKRERPHEIHYYDWRLTAWAMSEARGRLDATGRGVYRELLDYCHGQGTFPDDPDWICRQCACTREQLAQIWNVLEPYFPLIGKEKIRRHNWIADMFRKKTLTYLKLQSDRRKTTTDKSTVDKELRRVARSKLQAPININDDEDNINEDNKNDDDKQKPQPTQIPRVSEFPKTDAAIRRRCPSADLMIVTKIVHAASQAYVSVDRPKIPEPTDEVFAAAVDAASAGSRSQNSPGLFLTTVPNVIKSWAQLGRSPPENLTPKNRQQESLDQWDQL